MVVIDAMMVVEEMMKTASRTLRTVRCWPRNPPVRATYLRTVRSAVHSL